MTFLTRVFIGLLGLALQIWVDFEPGTQGGPALIAGFLIAIVAFTPSKE